MDIEDAPIIYGLELPARSLCAQNGETNLSRYLVATQSLRQENQVHLIEFDDENNQLEKLIYPHPCGEVWHISSSYSDPLIFSTCFSSFSSGELTTGCKIWKLPQEVNSEEGLSSIAADQIGNHPSNTIEEVADIKSDDIKDVSHVLWKPLEEDCQFIALGNGSMQLWDMSESPSCVSTFKIPERKGHQCNITNGKWNPHHGAKQFAVATGQNISTWDVRSQTQAFKIENAHGQLVRDLDYNPNKQYHIVTCGDDCLVKFWDVREPTLPVSVLSEDHSHWVWAARFNPFHDQLILSGGSDSRVVLYNKASISSEPYGQLLDEDLDEEDSDVDTNRDREPVKDGLIAVFDEHEDSVYAVEWSAADPWSFASLSYDGRVVINKVPKKVKFDILL
uniref:Protein TSSC1-like n=1 Tax=Phallusia mammillata TaxID=59560 RepID=A0A6F9DWB7_9ASCI|nr:protein TSSC1-like [Phallusia mammillata]